MKLEVSENLPRRNSKFSLARWIAKALLATVAAEDDLIAFHKLEDEWFADTDPVPVEIVEPTAFEIQLLGEHSFSRRRTKQVPPYLINDEGGNLFSKTLSASYSIVNYAQEVSVEHLSNIETIHGTQQIELLTEDLLVYATQVCRVPPLYLITSQGGVYKQMPRELITQHSIVKYAQIICEYLSNISIS